MSFTGIEKLDGLYCVFVNSRIVCACFTKAEAESALAKNRKEKSNEQNAEE